MGILSKYKPVKKEQNTQKKGFPLGFILIFVIGAILPSLLWSFSLKLFPPEQFPASLQNSTVYLLTAHPDDEAMFFGPILHRLQKFNNSVSVICFSTGDNKGLGHIRRTELENSVTFFGSPDNHVQVLSIIDDPEQFPDSMTAEWDPKKIALKADELIKADTSKDKINILSFDKFGVSHHINHQSIYKAAQLLSHDHGVQDGSEKPQIDYSFWTLNSVPIYQKYISIIDSFVIYLYKKFDINPYSSAISTVESITVVSDFEEYSKTMAAMTKAHVSQMEWFRYGWIVFSRYMVVNDVYRVL